ncbi:hypothetical protein Gpo141_00002541 [Globisporangium polare]
MAHTSDSHAQDSHCGMTRTQQDGDSSAVKMTRSQFWKDDGEALPCEEVLKDMNKMVAETRVVTNVHAIITLHHMFAKEYDSEDDIAFRCRARMSRMD